MNAISGERCSPHPHVFSDRVMRPGDPAYYDILHSYMGYRTCYYRTFSIGYAPPAMVDAYKRCRDYLDAAIELIRPGRTTAEVASVWPKAQEFGFPNEEAAFALQNGHGIGLAIWEKPVISRLVSLDHPHEIKPGMVFALETFWPCSDGWRAARIEEEIVVTPTGHEVITRFPAEELLVAGAPVRHRRTARCRRFAKTKRRPIHEVVADDGCRRAKPRRSERSSRWPLSVVMPALEMAQETGKVVSWLKKEGEQVRKGEPLLEVETDKAVVEIEALADGILGGVRAAVGDVVPVGQTIAWLLAPGEAVPATESAAPSARRMDGPTVPVATRVAPPSPAAGRDAKASPKARRLAAERGVDLRTIRGTGPGGEILTDDVLGAAATQAAGTTGRASEPGAIGRLMAERTTASWTSIPHFFLVREFDATGLIAYHQAHRSAFASRDVKVTLTDLFVAMTARALRRHPRMNASWSDDGIRVNADVNIALAVATPDGVVAPVIRRADALGLGDIAARRMDLTARAQEHRLPAVRSRRRHLCPQQSRHV